ncbi:MAG: TolB-like protein/tetratricopeptide (TPR) repeat protein [Glaciecola sp.]|jgi:TolB-like protein/tetratricopeptide (TPR) repeat protein
MLSIFNEFKRRNIYRVAAVYAIVGWVLVQIAAALEGAIGLPSWFDGLVVALLALIFPVALLLTWAFEMTPEGIKPTENANEDDITKNRHNLSDVLLIIATLIIIVFAGAEVAYFNDNDKQKNASTKSSDVEQKVNVADQGLAPNSTLIIAINPASIAVLPFSDLSPNNDQEYFSDGMAEEILNVLAKVKGLKVASRTSSFQFKQNNSIGIPGIAEKLSVRHVLEGSVRKAGDSIRISAQLIDAENDVQLWSDTFDKVLSTNNIFEIQDEIATAIVAKLGVVMDVLPEPDEVEVVASTNSLDAYELYLRAQQLFAKRSSLDKAIKYLEDAVRIDPDFARAWATLSVTYAIADEYLRTRRDWDTLGKAAAQRAITINPNLSLPYAALAQLAYKAKKPDFVQAFLQINRALEREPNETTALLWRGIYHRAVGDFENAEADFETCLSIDPAYWNCRPHLNRTFVYQNKISLAANSIKNLVMDGYDQYILDTLYVYTLDNDFDALLAYIVVYEQSRGAPVSSRQLLYKLFTEPNFNLEEHKESLFKIFETSNFKIRETSYTYRIQFAFWFRDYENVISNRGMNYHWMTYPKIWKESPHRKRLMIELGLPEYWREFGFPKHCKAAGADDFWCDGF